MRARSCNRAADISELASGPRTGKDGHLLKQDVDLVFSGSPKPLGQTLLPSALVTDLST